MSVREFHQAASISLEDLLDAAVVDTYYGDYRVSFEHNDTESWRERSDFLYGLCYTLMLPEQLVKQVVRKVTFKTKMKYDHMVCADCEE